jgi:flagellar biosynthetic protein FliR
VTAEVSDASLAFLVTLLLVFTRFSAMFILSPLLGRQSIPNAAKLGVSLMAALMLVTLDPPGDTTPFDNLPLLLGAVASELLAGLVMGFGVLVFFNIVYTAGHIIDMQIGFAMSQQYDPAVGVQVPVAGSLLNLILTLCFIIADGIPTLIAVMARSFSVVPPGTAAFPAGIAYVALEAFCNCFILSLNIAMPLLASALLAEIALGIIVRTAPQMNVFVIGIPIKVIVGLVTLLITVPMFLTVTGNLFDMMYDAVELLLTELLPV